MRIAPRRCARTAIFAQRKSRDHVTPHHRKTLIAKNAIRSGIDPGQTVAIAATVARRASGLEPAGCRCLPARIILPSFTRRLEERRPFTYHRWTSLLCPPYLAPMLLIGTDRANVLASRRIRFARILRLTLGPARFVLDLRRKQSPCLGLLVSRLLSVRTAFARLLASLIYHRWTSLSCPQYLASELLCSK